MKTIIAILTLFVSAQAFAIQPFHKLDDDAGALYPMDGRVSVEYVKPECSFDAVCLESTIVKINYNLFGCLDDAVTYSKVVNNNDGSTDIYVTALNISNKKSIAAFCVAMPMHQQVISLGGGMVSEESINVHFMGFPEGGLE